MHERLVPFIFVKKRRITIKQTILRVGSLSKLIKEKGNDAIDIIGRCISFRTVYDIMRDAIVKRKGRTGADIFDEIFKIYKSRIDDALAERQPRNDDEKALYAVYQKIEAKIIVDSSLKFKETSDKE